MHGPPYVNLNSSILIQLMIILVAAYSSSSSSSMYFPLLPSIFTKVNKNTKKRDKAEPQGQALVKRTCRGAKRVNKKMLVEKRAAQCKLEAGAIVIELKNN